MRRTLPRLAGVAVASCAAVAFLTAADTRKPTTEWLVRPSEAARVARVEAGLAPATLPGEEPRHLSVQQWMELYGVPGLSVAVFEKHALVWAKTYGVKQAGGTEPVTIDTLFQSASISKPVTALAAMRYAEQGKWSLDADINDKLVSWKVPENDFTKEQKVTLRRLLSHSAGLTVSGFPGYPVDAPRPTVQQILDGAKPANTGPVRVDLVPGTKTRYSGGGTTVVQLMMMDQLKKPFPQIMKETVLAPLGLKHSSYEQPLPPALAAMTATATRGDRTSVGGRWHVYPEMAAAGLWTTPSDLARIAIEVSKAKAGTSKRVVSQAMAKQMLTKQSETFGIGFQVWDGTDRFGHGGSNEGFRALLVAFADSGSGMALMANSENGDLLIERVGASITAEYGWKPFKEQLQEPLVMTADLLARLKGADAVLTWYEARHKAGPAEGLSPGILNQVGYSLLWAGKVPDALKVFEANVKHYPADANAYDSLGEAYLKAGKNPEAILNYKKSLELDPKNTNAVRMLEKLGARP
ncbi:beta-lactamase family protein [Pyxidicoccus xibeiensis]|uniref:beta-lactamase family protein n=1 Tax=Pyxidicoccus xibeiensis TaxID=2906759 RepID=UPI0020A76BDD|nr:beta-lactamase family protein [Pyxidicoccus xibeiensis]MCP3142957.1 beta-lactamase family protein [Pyxidicoccus xibeiensis]